MVPVFPLGVKKDVPGRAWSAGLPPPSFDPAELLDVIGGATRERRPRFATGFPRTPRRTRHRAQAGRGRRRRRPDRGPAAHPGRHQRGLRRHPHPELRPGVARRHLLRGRAHRRGRGAVAGGPRSPRARGLQRAEPREVRPHGLAGRGRSSTTARSSSRSRPLRAGRAGPGRALSPRSRRTSASSWSRTSWPWARSRRRRGSSRRRPSWPRSARPSRQVRARPAQRGGLRLGLKKAAEAAGKGDA